MYSKLLKEIEDLSITYKYKPLNNELKEKYHKLYKDNLNGFETKRNLNINNIPIAKKYERIVIGDYGAYVEFLPEDLLVELEVAKGQEWRLDKEFIKKRNLNLKYEWYEYQGYKVYLQTNTVTYADYRPGYYYISVLYFDKINNIIKQNLKDGSKIFFTGIGSRRTPKHIGYILKELSKHLTNIGYILRSGGASGADLDCESGVVNNLKEIYIPWKGFNSSDSTLYTKEDSEETIKIASENHPAYEYLKPPVKKLMNRNVYQVLGYDLKTPSSFVICYTPDGCKSHLTRTNKTGGTGLAISVASKHKIPIINLGNTEDLNWVISLLGIEKKLIDIGNEMITFKNTFNKDITESINLWLEDKLNIKDEYDFLNKYLPVHLKSNIITVSNDSIIGDSRLEYYTRKNNG